MKQHKINWWTDQKDINEELHFFIKILQYDSSLEEISISQLADAKSLKRDTPPFLPQVSTMVAHEGEAVFVNDSYFKSEFHFHDQFEFEIDLKLNFKFISNSISFENQFKFYFILDFYFKLTSIELLFYFLFLKFNLSMWPISASTNLVQGLFMDFYELS